MVVELGKELGCGVREEFGYRTKKELFAVCFFFAY